MRIKELMMKKIALILKVMMMIYTYPMDIILLLKNMKKMNVMIKVKKEMRKVMRHHIIPIIMRGMILIIILNKVVTWYQTI